MVKYTEAYFDHNNVSILVTSSLWTSNHPLDFLLHLNFPFRFRGGLLYMQKMVNIKKCAMHGVQSAI
jgi:hypothetical protein